MVAATTLGRQVEGAMTVQVSVVIGTYNRACLLEGTLKALASQEVPDSLSWEIIVVDNNSRDATAEVVRTFSKTTATPVRYVFEPRQGISHARNRGIQEAAGSIIAFNDDDVLPAPDWVARLPAAFHRWDAQGLGGRILPLWETPPPGWLAENGDLLARLAIMDFDADGPLTLPLVGRPQVWGANMAFRRELFERVGDFDPRLGVVGMRLFRGEETDLVRRALERGMKIAYDASLTVYHRIGADRMRKAYFRRLIFDDGQCKALVAPVARVPCFLGAPLGFYRVALTGFWKWLGLLLLRRKGAFDEQLSWLGAIGRLTGYWKAGLKPNVERESRS
jgi:glucosyl-dolichyl phosphate glucuronosyltransferase